MKRVEGESAAPPKPRQIKHTMNGDEVYGWYCYECQFSTRNVEDASAHDGKVFDEKQGQ